MLARLLLSLVASVAAAMAAEPDHAAYPSPLSVRSSFTNEELVGDPTVKNRSRHLSNSIPLILNGKGSGNDDVNRNEIPDRICLWAVTEHSMYFNQAHDVPRTIPDTNFSDPAS